MFVYTDHLINRYKIWSNQKGDDGLIAERQTVNSQLEFAKHESQNVKRLETSL